MSTVKAINLQHPTSGNANIVLDTSGNIISNGNIGLGTSSPESKLHISVPNGYSSNGSARFTVNTNTKLSQHISAATYGSSANATFQYGISFSPSTSGTQSAIVISENGSDGTALGFFTTNSYAGGPNLNMSIDPAGRITSPNQPSFLAYATTAGGSGQSSGVYIFGATYHNIGGHYSTSTGRFTAPVAGRYLFMNGLLSRSGGGMNTYLRKNGTPVIYSEDSRTGGYGEANITIIMNLAINDYVDIYTNNTAYGGLYDWFSGHLIG